MSFQEMISPSNCALALVDFQPAMFQGVQSHDRKVIVDIVQILAHTAKLFGVPVRFGGINQRSQCQLA